MVGNQWSEPVFTAFRPLTAEHWQLPNVARATFWVIDNRLMGHRFRLNGSSFLTRETLAKSVTHSLSICGTRDIFGRGSRDGETSTRLPGFKRKKRPPFQTASFRFTTKMTYLGAIIVTTSPVGSSTGGGAGWPGCGRGPLFALLLTQTVPLFSSNAMVCGKLPV